MKTVKPCYLTINDGHVVNASWDVIQFWPLIIFIISSMSMFKITLTFLPEFTPTLKMLELHADKGGEDWEIYAECVRDLMLKQSGRQKSDQPLREKVAFEKLLNGVSNQCLVGGKTYYFNDATINPQDASVEEKEITKSLIN